MKKEEDLLSLNFFISALLGVLFGRLHCDQPPNFTVPSSFVHNNGASRGVMFVFVWYNNWGLKFTSCGEL